MLSAAVNSADSVFAVCSFVVKRWRFAPEANNYAIFVTLTVFASVVNMPVFHTKTIESILEPVAQQVGTCSTGSVKVCCYGTPTVVCLKCKYDVESD